MRVFVVEPPAPIVDWVTADAHLKLDGDTSQQAYVEGLIAAATAHIDGPSGWLGRSLGRQTLEARLDNFGCGSVRLPFGPIISVTSVKYVDGSGAEQTIADASYELQGDALVPVHGASWPTPRWQREAVRVRYVAGYDGEEGRLLPAQIKAAILLMVGDLFENRETARAGNVSAVPMSTTVDALLDPLRIYS